jgi:hypothetical protein
MCGRTTSCEATSRKRQRLEKRFVFVVVRLPDLPMSPNRLMAKLLKEKPGRSFQLLGGFEQKPATHTLLALLVSFDFH